LVELDPGESHQLINVLRLRKGDAVEVFDGKGSIAEGVVSETGRKVVTLEIGGVRRIAGRGRGRVVIAASCAKGNRFEQLVRQCTELGVDHIAAVVFERTVKLGGGSGVQERYRNQAVAAAKQSGRNFLPEITGPAEFSEVLDVLQGGYSGGRIFFGGFSERALPISRIKGDGSDVICFIGPEGGLSGREESVLLGCGGVEVSLGVNVLRIETAGVAFAAVFCTGRGE